jgi:hypothetical protein
LTDPEVCDGSSTHGSAAQVVEIIQTKLPARLSEWGLQVQSFTAETSASSWPITIEVLDSAFQEPLTIALERESLDVAGPEEQANVAMNVICALIDERLHEKR